jgi:hypothetical protein
MLAYPMAGLPNRGANGYVIKYSFCLAVYVCLDLKRENEEDVGA